MTGIKQTIMTLLLITIFPGGSATAQGDVVGGGDATEASSTEPEAGDLDLNFRIRAEGVNQPSFSEDAIATTLRSRLTWSSAEYSRSWQVLAEVDNVSAIGAEQFNSTANGQTQYPVVADPKGTEINRAQLTYRSKHTSTTIGRQRINHENQRFLGGVGWRQNEQTFDAFSSRLEISEKFSADYSYIWNVNRIFGPAGDNANLRGNLHAAKLGYSLNTAHRFAVVHYSLDFDDAVMLANRTTGIHYQGKSDYLKWELGAAWQFDLGQNPMDYRAPYYLANISTRPIAGAYKTSFTAGFELLGAADDGRFITPLGTLHKFQGFADQFLNTPPNGIRDIHLGAGATLAGITLAVTLHDYQADRGNAEYGNEADLVASYTLSPKIKLMAKYASYRADQWRSDTDKFWLAMSYAL